MASRAGHAAAITPLVTYIDPLIERPRPCVQRPGEGTALTIVAVPAQIYLITDSSAYVGLTGVFGLVPLVVFGLWGGAWADAMDRRTLLIIASCGLALASALLWLQAALAVNNVWVVLCLLAVQQAFFAINSPTQIGRAHV